MGALCGSYSGEKACRTRVFPAIASTHEVGWGGLAKEEVGKEKVKRSRR